MLRPQSPQKTSRSITVICFEDCMLKGNRVYCKNSMSRGSARTNSVMKKYSFASFERRALIVESTENCAKRYFVFKFQSYLLKGTMIIALVF